MRAFQKFFQNFIKHLKRTNKVGSTHLEWLSRNRSQSCVVVFLAELRDKIMHFVEINKISSTYETFSFLRYNAIFFTKYQKCHSLVFSYSFVGNFANYVSYTIYTIMMPFLRFSIYSSVLTIYLRYITIVRFSLHNCAKKFSSIMISKCNIITNV